ADLDLVIEERERQFRVERLYPERHSGELDGQRVDVHAVDAALDYIAPESGLYPALEVFAVVRVIRRELYKVFAHLAGAQSAIRQGDLLALLGVVQLAVMAERPVQRLGQIVQCRHEEGCATTRRVADLQTEDDFRLPGDERAVVGLIVAERL